MSALNHRARTQNASVKTYGINTNVAHSARIDVAAGEQAVVLVGTEQALGGPHYGLGEAGVMLRGHGFIP